MMQAERIHRFHREADGIRAVKSLLIVVILLGAACSSQRPNSVSNTANELTVSATPPFSTKEPERYQATRTVTTSLNGNVVVRKVVIHRDGQMRREEYYDPDLPNIIYLTNSTGSFVLDPDERIFSEVSNGTTGPGPAIEDQMESSTDHLTQIDSVQTAYQRVGTESVLGRTATKYRVVVNSSGGGAVSSSESTIWVDETLGMPIKSETRQANGSLHTMELGDIKLQVDGGTFTIPEDFQKIDLIELRRRLKR
jgi:outer membrane lipoprotein-sorting protein